MAAREPETGYPIFEWINRRIGVLSVVIVVVAVGLGIVGPLVASEEEPAFDPGGEIYDTDDLVEERFSSDSPIRGAMFVVEALRRFLSGLDVLPDLVTHDENLPGLGREGSYPLARLGAVKLACLGELLHVLDLGGDRLALLVG